MVRLSGIILILAVLGKLNNYDLTLSRDFTKQFDDIFVNSFKGEMK